MKKIVAVLLVLTFILCGCGKTDEPGDKIKIVTTLFPQYDFARQIAGDKAEVSLILPPGVETHSFEPAPSDIIKINQSDLLIYTSKYMEPWADKLVLEGGADGVSVWQAASGINHEKHGADIDAHVWTNPKNAILMAENILRALCTVDSKNSDYYVANYDLFTEKLFELDKSFEKVISEAPIKKMVFGTRFSLHYFAERYGISHIAAFDSCGHDGEPSPKTLTAIVDTIREENLPAVFYGELESSKTAETIAAEAGVKAILFHSCHNVTKEELSSGETYISLMEKNIEALKEGLYND